MVEYVFAPGTNNERTIGESNLIRHNPVKTHTGIGDLRATFAVDPSILYPYAQRQDRVNVKDGNTVHFTGYVTGVTHTERSGESRVKGVGIAKQLEETRPDYENIGGSVTYSSIALEDAIADYWGRTPFNATVNNQDTETVATDASIQSADANSEWNDITLDIADNIPVAVQNGYWGITQDGFVQEAETADTNITSPTVVTNGDFSDGEGLLSASVGDEIYLDFTLNHRIPSPNFIYSVHIDTTGAPNHNAFDILLDGAVIDSVSAGQLSEGVQFYDGNLNDDVTAGNHRLTFETTSNDDEFDVDILMCFDDQDNKTYPPTLNSNGFFNGPELYPTDVGPIELEVATASFNINQARVNSDWRDDAGGTDALNDAQFIQVSPDDGSTWLPNDGSQNNTNSIDVSITQPTRSIIFRANFDRFGTDTFDTPTQGRNGQAIDVFNLLVDGDNLVVIDELELSRNHFNNLQKLHEYGDFLWTIEHDASDIANLTVNSYQRGEETRPAPPEIDNPVNQTPEVQAETYYNTIYLQGAEDVNGDRPTAEVKDQTAINDDGREISPGVLRDPTITTEAGATFRARALLEQASKNNQLTGSVTIPPTEFINPGYAYPVDFGEGETNNIAERVSLSESGNNVGIDIQFVSQSNIASDISELRRQTRDIGDKV